MRPLNDEQRRRVEENMDLVGQVIKECVHTLHSGSLYNYDDLYQIGCIGLCKAAQSDKPGSGAAFSTYAYILIRNEIYNQLDYATRRGRELATDPETIPCSIMDEDLEQTEACASLMSILDRAEATATGVALKGIHAIRLLVDGYSNREIGELYGVPANHVTAWVSKARKLLAEQRA